MHRLKILLSILILSQSSFAGPLIPNAMTLTKGMAAPYDGVLLSNDTAKQLYGHLLDCDAQKQTNISLLKSLSLMQNNEVIYKSEIQELKTQNQSLDTSLVKAESNGFWNRCGYFILGAVITGLTVYAIKH